MIIGEGARRVSVEADEDTARFVADRVLSDTRAASPTAATGSASVRAVVEVTRRHGGMRARALVGGLFTPRPGEQARLEVGMVDESLTVGRPATCVSRLGRPLVPGLPAEFATPVLARLGQDAAILPPGVLAIDRAAYDEVESSPLAFTLAAQVLAAVVATTLAHGDLAKTVSDLVDAW